jgi:hypothetical protein
MGIEYVICVTLLQILRLAYVVSASGSLWSLGAVMLGIWRVALAVDFLYVFLIAV